MSLSPTPYVLFRKYTKSLSLQTGRYHLLIFHNLIYKETFLNEEIPMNVKRQVFYIICVWPALTYGWCQTSTLTKYIIQRMNIFQRKLERKMLGKELKVPNLEIREKRNKLESSSLLISTPYLYTLFRHEEETITLTL